LIHEQVKDVPEFLQLGVVLWDVYDLRMWLQGLKAATVTESIHRDSINEAALSGLVPRIRTGSYTQSA
jgi:hypothetical protein